MKDGSDGNLSAGTVLFELTGVADVKFAKTLTSNGGATATAEIVNGRADAPLIELGFTTGPLTIHATVQGAQKKDSKIIQIV